MEELVVILQQFVNLKAVILAVALTQAIKYFLPSPVPGEKSTEVIPGHLTTRLLPFFPVIVGFIVTYFLEADSSYTLDDGVKGIMSGIMASYTYRTAKVSFFGG